MFLTFDYKGLLQMRVPKFGVKTVRKSELLHLCVAYPVIS